MPSMPTDLTAAELSAISDGDDIRLQRAAFEVGRRRHAAKLIDAEVDALAKFVARPVNRASFPMTCEAIQRMLEAHAESGPGE